MKILPSLAAVFSLATSALAHSAVPNAPAAPAAASIIPAPLPQGGDVALVNFYTNAKEDKLGGCFTVTNHEGETASLVTILENKGEPIDPSIIGLTDFAHIFADATDLNILGATLGDEAMMRGSGVVDHDHGIFGYQKGSLVKGLGENGEVDSTERAALTTMKATFDGMCKGDLKVGDWIKSGYISQPNADGTSIRAPASLMIALTKELIGLRAGNSPESAPIKPGSDPKSEVSGVNAVSGANPTLVPF